MLFVDTQFAALNWQVLLPLGILLFAGFGCAARAVAVFSRKQDGKAAVAALLAEGRVGIVRPEPLALPPAKGARALPRLLSRAVMQRKHL